MAYLTWTLCQLEQHALWSVYYALYALTIGKKNVFTRLFRMFMLGWNPAPLSDADCQYFLENEVPFPDTKVMLTHNVCANLSSKILKNCTSVVFDVWFLFWQNTKRWFTCPKWGKECAKKNKENKETWKGI